MTKGFISYAITKAVNTTLVLVPFIIVWFQYYEPLTMTVQSKQSSVLVLMFYFVVFYTLCTKLDGFRVSIFRVGDLIFSQIIAVGATDVFATFEIWALSIHFPNLIPGLCCFIVQCVVIVLICIVSSKMFFATHEPYKTAVVYDFRHGMQDLITEYGLEKRFNVKETHPVEEVLADLCLLNKYGVIFLCGVHSHERNIILKHCIENDIKMFIIPRVGDVLMSGAERIHMFHLPFLRAKRYNPTFGYRFFKRTFDVIVSGVAIIITSPVMLIVALLVKKDGGPAFYKQVRLTKNNKEFEILKFRSMRVDAEKFSGAVLSSGENDPRITSVGRIIRAYRLDELPQLINIFKGDMSIVGPRPERPEIAEIYEEDMPEFRLRLQAKAGLTGYAQVYGKYNTTPYDKLLMDLMYIAYPSVLEDLCIMLATVRILFSKESTEGLGEEVVELTYKKRNRGNNVS